MVLKLFVFSTALCREPCQHGGRCIQEDVCWCTKGYMGNACQFSKYDIIDIGNACQISKYDIIAIGNAYLLGKNYITDMGNACQFDKNDVKQTLAMLG